MSDASGLQRVALQSICSGRSMLEDVLLQLNGRKGMQLGFAAACAALAIKRFDWGE